MKRRRRSTYRLGLALLACVGGGVLVWHLVWTFLLATTKPINFDTSVLKDFKYLNELSEQDRQEPLHRYGYNILNSRHVDPLRDVPDTRHPQCKTKVSPSARHELPTISVVVTFTNVDRSLLLRNVVSILTRSAPVTIVEVVLVDDGSELSEEGQLLSEIPGVTVIRNEVKRGRGLARTQGVVAASGEIVVFVDGLAEVNTQWLLPLVLRLVQFPKSVVSPVIDLIDHETFEYKSLPGLFRGGFDWSLQFHWEEVPARHHSYDDPTEPFRSPALSGSVFAVWRDVFLAIGGYDPGQGARETEDLELSLRAWMCGGKVEMLPCSRVGVVHTGEGELRGQATSFSSYMRSARRVAEIWLDEYKRFFYSTRPTARMQLLSDIGSQRKLRERLRCKTFKWFLSSVYQKLQPLVWDEMAFGSIRQAGECLDVDPGQLPLVAKLRTCDSSKSSQEWSWRRRGVIVSNGMCLTSDLMHMQGYVSVQFCKDISSQVWLRHQTKIVHQDTGLCLDGRQAHTGLVISDCLQDQQGQAWELQGEPLARSPHQDYLDGAGML